MLHHICSYKKEVFLIVTKEIAAVVQNLVDLSSSLWVISGKNTYAAALQWLMWAVTSFWWWKSLQNKWKIEVEEPGTFCLLGKGSAVPFQAWQAISTFVPFTFVLCIVLNIAISFIWGTLSLYVYWSIRFYMQKGYIWSEMLSEVLGYLIGHTKMRGVILKQYQCFCCLFSAGSLVLPA